MFASPTLRTAAPVALNRHTITVHMTECRANVLRSVEALRKSLQEVATCLDFAPTVFNVVDYDSEGVTVELASAEGRMRLRARPEAGRADFYFQTSRPEANVERIVELVFRGCGAKEAKALHEDRISGKRNAKHWDFGKTLFTCRTPFQLIELTKGPLDVTLFLDGRVHFIEKYERRYHEPLVHFPLAAAPRLDRVGIGGAGDGLVMREVLAYPELGNAIMYELDPFMIEIATNHPEMARINECALQHDKAKVVAANALEMFGEHDRYDALILDFPSFSDGDVEALYSPDFYRTCLRCMNEGAVLITQCTDYNKVLARIATNLREVFKFVLPVDMGKSIFPLNYVMASMQPFRQRRALPASVHTMKDVYLELYFEKILPETLKVNDFDGWLRFTSDLDVVLRTLDAIV
jgi:spermidine synthase